MLKTCCQILNFSRSPGLHSTVNTLLIGSLHIPLLATRTRSARDSAVLRLSDLDAWSLVLLCHLQSEKDFSPLFLCWYDNSWVFSSPAFIPFSAYNDKTQKQTQNNQQAKPLCYNRARTWSWNNGVSFHKMVLIFLFSFSILKTGMAVTWVSK